MLQMTERVFYAFGGLFGALGITSYAISSHHGGYFGVIAPILLCNACALLALAISLKYNIILRLAGVLIIIGVTLFTIDLMTREFTTHHLFPYAAPLGGVINILGWVLFVIYAFVPRDKEAL